MRNAELINIEYLEESPLIKKILQIFIVLVFQCLNLDSEKSPDIGTISSVLENLRNALDFQRQND